MRIRASRPSRRANGSAESLQKAGASRKSLTKTCFCILSALPDLERLGFYLSSRGLPWYRVRYKMYLSRCLGR